jgi:serine protease AprX
VTAILAPTMVDRAPGLRRAQILRAVGAAVLAVAAAAAVGSIPSDRTATAPSHGAPAPAVTAALDPGIPAGAAPVGVVVQGRPGLDLGALAATVARHGGEVVAALPIVDGFSVRIPGDGARALATEDGIVAITLDRSVSFETVSYDESGTASAFVGASGAHAAWRTGNLGKGVGVAVIDTGVSEMPDFTGRLVHGPDLSGEGKLIDTYGHGTVMAGVIAGSGHDSMARTGGAYTGIAPEAHIVAVKVAGANGAADVSTLLQAMHWVAAYQQQFNIRVLNLSWGTTSTQDPTVDPLNHAVQRLWRQGIVVVVAAGNRGPNAGTIMKPADDPMVLTVGAFNDNGTVALGDDEGVSWSSVGPTAQGHAKPDVVASGRRLVSQRSHGSTVATENPKALVSPSYIRGSGSSQAAAVTSGAAALLLNARPELTPDQVKSLLVRTADPINGLAASRQGSGRLDLAEALTAPAGPTTWQTPTATGLGSIEASRGGRHVQSDCGQDGTIDLIKGEIDVRCEAWNGSSWAGSSWAGDAWTGSSWAGSSWAGSSWAGSSWAGSSWAGSSWAGGEWTGSSWAGAAWTGSSWAGSSWAGSSWAGSSWAGSSWAGSSWAESSWTTGEYDTEEDLFLTAWWGASPPAGKTIPGEIPATGVAARGF